MNFQSFHFFSFLLTTIIMCGLLRNNNNWRNNVLVIASYYFYMSWDWRFAALLIVATLSNFYAGRVISRASDNKLRRYALYGALITNLGVLATFKYLNFFIESAVQLLHKFGFEANAPLLEIILPIGISFFTFQSLSYSIDCYRNKIRECSSLRDFALFVSFFPTVLSGPITRADQLLPQIADSNLQYKYSAESGLILVCRGFIKKIVFADILAVQIVNPAFDNPAAYSSIFLVTAVYAYSFQIYMDLSAYTDIARGIARMLGFQLPENFNQPYRADSISNFWQRWHISMSSFFRDYLYYAFGGSIKGNVYLNLLITFIAIGLWHGAGWNFILYGFIHGALVGIERFFRSRRKDRGLPPLPEHGFMWLIRVLVVFQIVAFSRILFRAEDLTSAANYLFAITQNTQLNTPSVSFWPMLILFGAAILHYLPPKLSDSSLSWCARQPTFIQSLIIIACILFLYPLVSGDAGFVYFQF